jgi:beta-glucosidase
VITPTLPQSTVMDVETILESLTLEEKSRLTSGSSFWRTAPVARLGVPAIQVSDGPHGLRSQDPAAGDHVGLGDSAPATCFPTASAIASSWNPALLGRVGEALAKEAKALKVSVVLGPGVNIKRSPLCGRNFEYFSEDPLLTAELAAAMVDGIQEQGVGASLKHYAANNQETDRMRVDVQVDERTMREIYLPAFETVVRRCQPWTVMCSYNKVNGESASANSWLLDTVLRGEFGFNGLVISDWGAVYDRVAALRAGTDLEMPPHRRSPGRVAQAVESGEVPIEVLDARARAVLELVAKGRHVLELDERVDLDAHHYLAREAAAESIVLLRNEGGVLPLAKGTSVALIGELARTPRYQGAGSSQVNPTRLDSVLESMTGQFDVTFAPGYLLDDGHGSDGSDADLRARAVEVARSAEVVVVCIGLPAADESEGFDRTHMHLPRAHLEALAAVAEANPRVITVLANGSTVVLDEVTQLSAAVVEAWLGGQAAGSAIVDVLSGEVNPSGRLAETIPLRLEDNSSFLNFPGDSQEVRYGEGIFVGYRGYDASRLEVCYPFGFGLSYTQFELSDLSVVTQGNAAAGDLKATVTVTLANTGVRDGAEVVQVYVSDLESSAARPVRELAGFAKVQVPAGESREVLIELEQRAFSYFSTRLGRWVVEPGEFSVEVGQHSRELPLATVIRVDAPSIGAALTADSTLHEWLADPVMVRLIAQEVAGGQADPSRDPHLVSVIGSAPMSTLVAFEGLSLDEEALERVVKRRAQLRE